MLLVARVVHAGDHLRDAVALACELADDQVVLVVSGPRARARAGGRSRRARGRAARSRRRAAPVLELLLQLLEAMRTLLDQRDLVAHRAPSARCLRRPCRRRRRSCTSGSSPASFVSLWTRRRAPRWRSASDRSSACPASRRTPRGPDRAPGRRRTGPRSASRPPGRSRCSCCRRSWRRRRRRPRRARVAKDLGVHSVADDEASRPAGPSRESASSFSSTAVTSQPSSPSPGRRPSRPGHNRSRPVSYLSGYSSRTPWGKATTRTSQGAFRST